MGTMNEMLIREKVINPENIQAATIIFATVPIVLVYPFLQKHFTKGILIGALKG
jgi:putative aldouronate transport system permease protein